MKHFLENLSKDLGSLGEVKQYNQIFKEYKLVYFDSPFNTFPGMPKKKEWYLRGAKGVKERGTGLFSKPEILISIINLAKEIEEKAGLKEELAFSDEIVEWCKKYGHPFEESYFSENYYEDSKGNPLNKEDYISEAAEKHITGYCGFRVREFKRRIAVLYSIFQLWYGLTFSDMRKVIEFSPILSKIDTNKDLDEQLLDLKRFLPYRIWQGMSTEISLEYNEKTDSYIINPYTDNLISVAYFQLAMMMSSKGIKGVTFCSMCHKLFEIEHGNKKICPDCDREYHRIKMQESREKKKRNCKIT